MSCCGGGRRAAGGGAYRPARRTAQRHRRYTHAFIRYTGKGVLTVQGPASGRQYRFVQAGATLPVDPRDVAALARVPALIQVASP
jgi:hypothetical protein